MKSSFVFLKSITLKKGKVNIYLKSFDGDTPVSFLYNNGKLLHNKKGDCMFKLILTGIVSGFINGLFGAGGGVISVLALTMFLKTEKKKAHATTVMAILAFSLVSIFTYGMKGNVDWISAVTAGLSGAVGGAVGAYLLKKIPVKYVSKIFGILMLASSWRLLCS